MSGKQGTGGGVSFDGSAWVSALCPGTQMVSVLRLVTQMQSRVADLKMKSAVSTPVQIA